MNLCQTIHYLDIRSYFMGRLYLQMETIVSLTFFEIIQHKQINTESLGHLWSSDWVMKFYEDFFWGFFGFFLKVNICFGFIFSLDNTVKMTCRRQQNSFQADWLADSRFKARIQRNIEPHKVTCALCYKIFSNNS